MAVKGVVRPAPIALLRHQCVSLDTLLRAYKSCHIDMRLTLHALESLIEVAGKRGASTTTTIRTTVVTNRGDGGDETDEPLEAIGFKLIFFCAAVR